MQRKMNNKNKRNTKAQIVAYDFLAGFVVFLVIIVVVTIYWFKTAAQATNDLEADTKMIIARDSSQMLVSMPGIPARWELNYSAECYDRNCTPGLGTTLGIVSQDKIDSFINISTNNYTRTKSLLNLGKYNFHFQVRDEYGTVLRSSGNEPGENLSISVRRISVLENRTIRLIDFTIY